MSPKDAARVEGAVVELEERVEELASELDELRACIPELVCAEVSRAFDPHAYPPLAAFTTVQAEAEAWAAIASVAELKLYVAAAAKRFSARDRAAFAAFLRRLDA